MRVIRIEWLDRYGGEAFILNRRVRVTFTRR